MDEPKFILLKGNQLKKLGPLLATATETIYGFSFGAFTLHHYPGLCFRYDRKGNLIKNDYLRTVLRVGDKFIIPGDDKKIWKAREILNKFPYLEDKWQPRWIDKKYLQIDFNLYVFGEHTIIITGKERNLSAYVIENKAVAASFKSLSNFLWENANPIV